MIYLDVTGVCESPMNTGVQRVVRSIYNHLAASQEVQPLLWNRRLQSYCKLSAKEWSYLTDPFGQLGGKALAEPRKHPYPFFWSKALRYLAHRRNRFDLEAVIKPGDTLFVPAAFLDNRIHLLPEMQARTKARHVAVFHDAIPLRLPEFTGPRPKARFQFYIRSLSHFSLVICPSRETEKDLHHFWKEHGHSPAPTCVEEWPVEFEAAFRNSPPQFPAKKIVCISTFENRKNQLTLLQAAEMLWKKNVLFKLQLIGQTTRHWGPKIEAEIDRLKTAGFPVEWLRHVDEETLHRCLEECSFTVFPSVSEGFGLPILESLWHRRPCICGGNGALGEVAGLGGCLTVNQHDTTETAQAMRQLLEEEETYLRLYQETGERQFRRWKNYTARLLDYFNAS